MKILVADDHPEFRRLVATSIGERTDHEVVTAEDGAKALELALKSPRPDVLILDWVMPKLTGTQVCRLVRGSPLEQQPYVLFVTARCRREELLECLASGADDLLTKPFAPDVLISRLDLAQRRSQIGLGGIDVEAALFDAQKEGEGELVVRSGKITARVLFCEGKVAWIQLADSFGSLLDAMGPEAGLDAEAAQLIVADCRRTGRGLGATLAAWGLVEGEQLRNTAKEWLKKKISSLRTLEQPQFLFLPGRQRCSPELLFDLSELLEETAIPSVQVPSAPGLPRESRPTAIPAAGWAAAFVSTGQDDPVMVPILRQCMRGEGVLGVAAINRVTGTCLGRRGDELDPDIAWAQVQMINSISQRELVQDALVCAEDYFHLVILVPSRPEVLVYAVVDNAKTVIATARLALRSAVRDSVPPVG